MRQKISLILIVTLILSFFSSEAQIKPEMVFVKGGTFKMGNPYTDKARKGDPDEKPVHEVTLSSFYIGKYEVTVKEYKEFIKDKSFTEFSNLREHKMPPAPDTSWLFSHPDTRKYYPLPTQKWWGWQNDLPMHHVTWYDAVAYCNWLSEKEGLEKCYYVNSDFGISCDFSKNGYRLPTEAEWEYAARGGQQSHGYRYSGSDNPAEVAWYDETTQLKGPMKVGTKKPNELGIYDMCGNVWEWTTDYYAKDFYSKSPKLDPVNTTSTPYRVLRGGAWHYRAEYATVTSRDGPEPSFTNYNYGFRLVRKAN